MTSVPGPKPRTPGEPSEHVELPPELLDEVLLFTDRMSKQNAAQVNRLWNAEVITVAKQQEAAMMNAAIEFIISQLDVNTDQETISELQAILKKNPIFSSTNLLEVKENLLAIREVIAHKLKK